MTEVLTIKQLTYKHNRTTILADLSLAVASGKIVGLLGANGAGKTTLMRLIVGAAKHYRGEIAVNGDDALVQCKADVSFSAQFAGPNSGQKLLQLACFCANVWPDFSFDQFQKMVTFLGLGLDQRLSAMSKGTRRKAIIALTLARQAPLYLLDEPFDGIDSMSRKKIIASIIKWKPERSTIIVSDHHVSDIANILDEVVIIKDKHVVAQEAADTIRTKRGQSIEDFYESFYEGGDEA